MEKYPQLGHIEQINLEEEQISEEPNQDPFQQNKNTDPHKNQNQ